MRRPDPATPTVLFAETKEWEREYLLERLPDLDARFSAEPLLEHASGGAAEVDVLSCFIRSRLGAEFLAGSPRLRLIATRSTGYDHIDLEACRAASVVVCHVPFYGENTVAEHTFGLILTLSRNIHKAYQRTVAGNFSPEGLTGFDLKGKTLGVIGTGSIGLHTIRIGRGFGMDVQAHDVREQRLLAEVLGFRYVPLGELLRTSDVVSLHLPAVPATHHLIDRDRLALTKRGALLVNTARGSLVDTEALLWALDQGILAGVGLDVLEGEEYLEDELQVLGKPNYAEQLRTLAYSHALLQRPNVVFTPHIGFNSHEALQRILDTTVENIRAFLAGHPVNQVLPARD